MLINDSTPDADTDSHDVMKQTLRHAITKGFGFKEQLPEALKYLLLFHKGDDQLIISAKEGEIFATLSKAGDEERTEVIEAPDVNNFLGKLSRYLNLQDIMLHNAEPRWISAPMVRHHSLDGVPQAGYSGSGPADTALSILAYLLPIEGPRTEISKGGLINKEAWNFHQEFKEQVLAAAPDGLIRLSVPQIVAWIQAKRAGREVPKVDVRHA